MPLGTLDRNPPPFFRQGRSPFSRLMLFGVLGLLLMVADARLGLVAPLRSVVATVLYPLQWVVMQPVQWIAGAGGYLDDLGRARQAEGEARTRLAAQSLKANQVDELLVENARLRGLLELRARVVPRGHAAEVLYDAADSYSRKVVIDRGLREGVVAGAPVIDEGGVLGQVIRVHAFTSEVSLLIDREHAIPVLNVHSGARSVAYGDPLAAGTGALELRFMSADADVREGDLLTTSGVDGVFPGGLPVARVARIERRPDSPFSRIVCTPLARVHAARHVVVLEPLQGPPLPAPDPAPGGRAGVRR